MQVEPFVPQMLRNAMAFEHYTNPQDIMACVNSGRVPIWATQDGEYAIFVEKITQGLKYECATLIRDHWKEIANFRDEIELEPRWEDYEKYEREGSFLLLVLRYNSHIIGYCAFVTRSHGHYRSLLVADNDVIFVDGNHRNQNFGTRLIDESEKFLKKLAKKIKVSWHMNPAHSFSPLLKRRKYIQEKEIWGKLL